MLLRGLGKEVRGVIGMLVRSSWKSSGGKGWNEKVGMWRMR